jgi:hypothetical protein
VFCFRSCSLLLANQFLDDKSERALQFARVAHVHPVTMANLKIDFLFRVSFSLMVTEDEIRGYSDKLHGRFSTEYFKQSLMWAGMPPTLQSHQHHQHHNVPPMQQQLHITPAIPSQQLMQPQPPIVVVQQHLQHQIIQQQQQQPQPMMLVQSPTPRKGSFPFFSRARKEVSSPDKAQLHHHHHHIHAPIPVTHNVFNPEVVAPCVWMASKGIESLIPLRTSGF